MNLFARRQVAQGALQPRYAYRVTIGNAVRVTTDPIEVARLRRAYPAALVRIVPVG